jgi:hypothetical protein
LTAGRRPPLAPDERIIAWATARPVAAPTVAEPADAADAADAAGTAGTADTPDAAGTADWAGGAEPVVVVTTLGLWLPGAAGRLGWHEIHKVTWSGRQLVVVAAREVGADDGYTIVADEPATVHTLDQPDRVPPQVRARVTKSIAYTRHAPLDGGGGVRVVARRVPGINGLRWTVRYDDGTDVAADGVREVTAGLVAEGRAEIESAVP